MESERNPNVPETVSVLLRRFIAAKSLSQGVTYNVKRLAEDTELKAGYLYDVLGGRTRLRSDDVESLSDALNLDTADRETLKKAQAYEQAHGRRKPDERNESGDAQPIDPSLLVELRRLVRAGSGTPPLIPPGADPSLSETPSPHYPLRQGQLPPGRDGSKQAEPTITQPQEMAQLYLLPADINRNEKHQIRKVRLSRTETCTPNTLSKRVSDLEPRIGRYELNSEDSVEWDQIKKHFIGEGRLNVLVLVVENIALRGSTIKAFLHSVAHAQTDNVQGVFDYLDMARAANDYDNEPDDVDLRDRFLCHYSEWLKWPAERSWYGVIRAADQAIAEEWSNIPNVERILKIYNDGLAKYPSEPRLRFRYSHFLTRTGRINEAIDQIQIGLRDIQDNPIKHEIEALGNSAWGEALDSQANQAETAQERRALRAEANRRFFLATLLAPHNARIRLRFAISLRTNAQYSAAISEFEEIKEVNPNMPGLWPEWRYSLFCLGRHAEVVETVDEQNDWCELDGGAHYDLACAYAKMIDESNKSMDFLGKACVELTCAFGDNEEHFRQLAQTDTDFLWLAARSDQLRHIIWGNDVPESIRLIVQQSESVFLR